MEPLYEFYQSFSSLFHELQDAYTERNSQGVSIYKGRISLLATAYLIDAEKQMQLHELLGVRASAKREEGVERVRAYLLERNSRAGTLVGETSRFGEELKFGYKELDGATVGRRGVQIGIDCLCDSHHDTLDVFNAAEVIPYCLQAV